MNWDCQNRKPLFIEKSEKSGIFFENTLTYTNDFNPYTYRNFYNGGGIALGDINNDGWIDIYFTGNQTNNKLYLNKGNWEFQDITQQAGVACEGVWTTGATFADINADGLLDLYVCKAGKPGGENRHNELFINNGDLTFTEKSREYGLDIEGLSVHAAFFDFDLDGDLDCYVLNNSTQSVGGYDLIKNQRTIPDPDGLGNKLFQQENNRFIDVTEKQNIYNSAIGFGLGITLSDFNADRRPDLFISNDFFEKDYLYYNYSNGFKEVLEQQMSSISMGSMGADAADLDNDLRPDLMVTEMFPSSLERQKTKALYEGWDKYSLAVSQGYYHQFPRNTLHRNVGNPGFFEIGRYADVMATDWSWASLIFDADNDGLKDIFVANGIYQDLLDRDYLDFTANEKIMSQMLENRESGLKELIDLIPSKAIPNVMYHNTGNFEFEEIGALWGLDTPSFSNGNAYGDLDNDGDLDLVVNNVNQPSFVYENTTDSSVSKYLSIDLVSSSFNTKAIGAKVIIKYGEEKQQFIEQFPSRGFQSSISNRLHFGVGSHQYIDSLIVLWPNQKTSLYLKIQTNQHITIEEPTYSNFDYKEPEYTNHFPQVNPLFEFTHQENNWNDFNRQRLLDQMHCNYGPGLAKSDLNEDGIEDFFVGGAKNQQSSLFVSKGKGFEKIEDPFKPNRTAEDVVAEFIDLNQDGLPDLYVGTSGSAIQSFDDNLKDRIYINKGNGQLELKSDALPPNFFIRTSGVTSADFDKDGIVDLFVTQHYDGQFYGNPGNGKFLMGIGDATFEEKSNSIFENLGMITSVKAMDINGDSWIDIVLTGQWMGIHVFLNNKGVFSDASKEFGLNNTRGLWNSLAVDDIDQDGDVDLFAGNHGTNTLLKPQSIMLVNDFDSNGTDEQIICAYLKDSYYPISDKKDLIGQLPGLKKKIPSHQIYSESSIDELFSEELIKSSIKYEIEELESCYFENQNGVFVKQSLPSEVQYAPIFAVEVIDANKDGFKDIILGGNQYLVKPKLGRYDASKGLIVYGSKNQKEYSLDKVSYLGVSGQIRNFKTTKDGDKTILVSAINNESVTFSELP